MPELFTVKYIQSRIRLVRGHHVLLQGDLACLYGVPMNRLLMHTERCPGEFCFILERSEIPAFSDEPMDDRHRHFAFTEHGAVAVACVLDTPEAVAMCVLIVRAFLQLRQTLLNHRTPDYFRDARELTPEVHRELAQPWSRAWSNPIRLPPQ